MLPLQETHSGWSVVSETTDPGFERITQSRDDSCQNACVAMLTSWTEQELIDEYGSPLSARDTLDLLREEYEFVRTFTANARTVLALAYIVESFIFSVESPIRERDPDLYERILEQDADDKEAQCRATYDDPDEEAIQWYRDRAEVTHAIAVHQGRLYDPRDPGYWPSIGRLTGDDAYNHEYEVQDVTICTNDPVLPHDEALPRTPGGVQ